MSVDHEMMAKALWDETADKVGRQHPLKREKALAVATFALEACRVFTMAGFTAEETRAKTDERVKWFEQWMGYGS